MVTQAETPHQSGGSPFATDTDAQSLDTGAARLLFEDATEHERYTRLYDWTWCISLTPQARTIYAYLRYRAGSSDTSWPERPVIAAVVGVSERKVHDGLHELELNGLIEIVSRRTECKPSDYVIKSKDSVAAVQRVLQNLQDPRPLADSARPSCTSCKTHLQILQLDKDRVDTSVDTSVDTVVGAPAPGALVAAAEPPATAPRPPSSTRTKSTDLERVSTEDDTGAAPPRRLALDLARLLGWSNIGAATLRRFEGYMVVRLALPHSPDRYTCAEERLLAFHDWLHSNGWWQGRGHMFTDAQMAKEWNDWVGQGEPRAKRSGRGGYR